MEFNQTKDATKESIKKVVREATEEEKRFAAHIKNVPMNVFRGIVYYI